MKRSLLKPGPSTERRARSSLRGVSAAVAAIAVLLTAGGCSTTDRTATPPAEAQPDPAAVPEAPQVRVFGSLRGMFHQGQVGAEVALDAVLPDVDLYGVGALQDLAGEITIVGGRAYLSYPTEQGSRTDVVDHSDAGAALLVLANVEGWVEAATPQAIAFDQLDAALPRLAAEAGLSADGRLPFLMEGSVEALEWHVIDGARLEAGGRSHHDHLAAAQRFQAGRAAATLVGFWSATDQGVFTHMDSRTHVHVVVHEPLASGHVDDVTIPAGSVVRFPRWRR